MKMEYLSYLSSDGVTPIEYSLWTPDKEPKAVIQIVHGMSEHIGRYQHFAEFMVNHGFAVCGHNQLGHGRSLPEGVVGYFGKEGSYRNLVEDVYGLRGIIRDTFGDKSVILMGHSMGSFVARLVLTRYSSQYDGAIISGTSGSDLMGEYPGYLLVKAMIALKGERVVDEFVHQQIIGTVRGAYGQEDEHAWMTKSPVEQAKAAEDPLFGFPLTLGGYRELLSMLRLVNSPRWASSILEKSLPIYLFSGEKDPVGQYGKGVVQVRDRLVEAGMQNVTLKLYEEGRHEMLNEVNQQQVELDILHWVDQVLEG